MKRIFDPVHRFIELEEAEVALLDTAPMQRLRRLRQLGLAYLAFPAAEHSRFTHALGALATGERILASLRDHGAAIFASEREFAAQRRLLRTSLLLHDVGHGPFSHACEAVLGVNHEARTSAIMRLPEMRRALDRLEVDGAEVTALVTGTAEPRNRVLKELVSGPNLDADRMDYLLRDAYFTGVASGHFDADQLIGALRAVEVNGSVRLGVDGRGVVALESFVLARYMMFATVYFHHTVRSFERVLQEALREIWPEPGALDPIEAFLAWDDFRVLDALRTAPGEAARALRDRRRLYVLVAEWNGERDVAPYEACLTALRERFGDAVWGDEQQQLLHRLPLDPNDVRSVMVQQRSGVVPATEASDLIARLVGRAYWRKLFVRAGRADVAEARRICEEIVRRT
jgi:HD superfamily phosphohydrolase